MCSSWTASSVVNMSTQTHTFLRVKHWLENELGRTVTSDELIRTFGIGRSTWHTKLRNTDDWLTPDRAFNAARSLGIHPRRVFDELNAWESDCGEGHNSGKVRPRRRTARTDLPPV